MFAIEHILWLHLNPRKAVMAINTEEVPYFLILTLELCLNSLILFHLLKSSHGFNKWLSKTWMKQQHVLNTGDSFTHRGSDCWRSVSMSELGSLLSFLLFFFFLSSSVADKLPKTMIGMQSSLHSRYYVFHFDFSWWTLS